MKGEKYNPFVKKTSRKIFLVGCVSGSQHTVGHGAARTKQQMVRSEARAMSTHTHTASEMIPAPKTLNVCACKRLHAFSKTSISFLVERQGVRRETALQQQHGIFGLRQGKARQEKKIKKIKQKKGTVRNWLQLGRCEVTLESLVFLFHPTLFQLPYVSSVVSSCWRSRHLMRTTTHKKKVLLQYLFGGGLKGEKVGR